jgi:membrane protease YdiL (CAAX protease family)
VAAALAGRPENADGLPSFGPLADLAFEFLLIAALLPPIFAAARWVQRRPAGTLSSVTGRLRLRWLLTCLPVAAAAVVVLLGGGIALAAATGEDVGLGDGLAGWGPFIAGSLVLVAVVPLQAAAEEYLTRGWLLQVVGSICRGPWVPIAVQAVVFAALHGWGTPWGFADLILFSVVTGWLTVRTGGLEAAIALHVMNNLIAGMLSAASGTLYADETAADMPWQLAVIDVPVLLAYAAVIVLLARRRRLATLSAGPVAAPVPVLERPLVSLGRDS